MATAETGLARRNSSANARKGSGERATSTRLQWRCASARAKAIPRPREAPVIRAQPSFFISVLAQGTAHSFGESRLEHAVPETRGDAVAFVDSARAVVVQRYAMIGWKSPGNTRDLI